jgi:hypothetical protein
MMRYWNRYVRFSVWVTSILSPLLLFGAALKAADVPPSVSLNWLDKSPPSVRQGVNWGVPWPKGKVQKGQTFTLKTAAGKELPLQTWPLAYWPDGSIKWTGFATVAGPNDAGPLTVAVEPAPATGSQALQVTQTDAAIEIDTGALKCHIPKQGSALIDSLSVEGREVARHGQLECILQTAPDTDHVTAVPRERYVSSVKKVTLEQSGPVRAVVKIEGMHKSEHDTREWLPFVVRFYFCAGQEQIRMVHTVIFDGDQEKDFIRGLGLTFEVPFREEVQNRHVRFSNSNGGLWAEPVLLPSVFGGGRGGRRGDRGGAPAQPPVDGQDPTSTNQPFAGPFGGRGFGGRGGGPNQLDGERMGPTTSELARWDAFKLVQPNADGFTIVKRTNPKSSWVAAAEGQRASGLVFVGDVSGGLAVGVKNFWQCYPASLEVQNATSPAAQLQVWLWSPDGPAMDLRHYDIRGHGPVNGGSGSYEDYEADFATPVGVARTSDLMLFPSGNVPSRAVTMKQANANAQPALLVCSPQYLHATGVFGLWSLPDRSTPFKKEVEDRLDSLVDYYEKAIDQHHWYGYWNFGDIRHAYDAQRHAWRYDVGGFAWDNSELGTVLWLWYSYLRTGRADIFRMAEAMSRHNSEVDTYHLGRFAGLGSRHNVSHWGDSAKEARISQAAHNRFYYYLTTDERVGDVLHEVVNVDAVASKLDPMRKAQPITEAEKKYPGRIRMGPDWLAFVGNWMTEWERTGDTKWRDKILAGVDSIAQMTYWMRSGRNLVVGYDPATGKLYQVDDQPGTYNLTTIQGGAEVAFELTGLLDNPTWTKIWLQYCRLGSAPAEVLLKDKETGTEGADASLMGEQGGPYSQGTPRLAAYAYYRTRNTAFAQWAIRALAARAGRGAVSPQRIEGAEVLNPVDEALGVGSNDSAQSSLTAIEILELCADQMPAEPPPPDETYGGFRGRRGGAPRGQPLARQGAQNE